MDKSTQTPTTPPRVLDRNIVSQPDRVIQVERVSVSREQQQSIATAIRTGRQSSNSE